MRYPHDEGVADGMWRVQTGAMMGGSVCVAAVALTAVMLGAGLAVKTVCVGPSVTSEPTPCYSDIKTLYAGDQVKAGGIPYVDHFVEYPVLTGVYMWTAGAFAHGPRSYLAVSAIGLAAAGLATAWMLAWLAGRRAFLWCLAPTFALTAFLNWDLLAVAAMVAAIFAWRRGHSLWAAAWLGVGCALKLFPILMLAPLVLERWFGGKRREAAQVALVGLGVAAAANIPFALANFSGWWQTYLFHERRGADRATIWAWGLPQISVPTLNLAVTLATALSLIAILAYALVRLRREGRFAPVATGAAMIFVVLAWSKIYSPQYTLWVLPLLVIVAVPSWLVAAYLTIDSVLWISAFAVGYPAITIHTSNVLVEYGAWARTIVLLLLAVYAVRSRPDRSASARAGLEDRPVQVHAEPEGGEAVGRCVHGVAVGRVQPSLRTALTRSADKVVLLVLRLPDPLPAWLMRCHVGGEIVPSARSATGHRGARESVLAAPDHR